MIKISGYGNYKVFSASIYVSTLSVFLYFSAGFISYLAACTYVEMGDDIPYKAGLFSFNCAITELIKEESLT